MKNVTKKRILVASGLVAVALGILGIFLPVLPTTPFLLLAAACFARSSEKFHNWLMNSRLLGSYIRDYMEGRGIPLKNKVVTIILLWITIGLSVAFGIQNIVLRIILIVIAAAVSLHIFRIKTRK